MYINNVYVIYTQLNYTIHYKLIYNTETNYNYV